MGDYEDSVQTRRLLVWAVQVISAIATLSHKTNQRSGAAGPGLVSWRMKAFQR